MNSPGREPRDEGQVQEKSRGAATDASPRRLQLTQQPRSVAPLGLIGFCGLLTRGSRPGLIICRRSAAYIFMLFPGTRGLRPGLIIYRPLRGLG